ncbi:hypothetical protein PGT21_036733 [Puccinia graminis f. sp. tritici]|uniref:Uncharacterized protein n=1 Tax=Puccinia graminis f. sp. tritici TaxID=56615 RepID=A0A5B0QQ63_PUCGR|nr:hypothetical protein PGT21_036733 [Puccinia graminis f. sp. tritici]
MLRKQLNDWSCSEVYPCAQHRSPTSVIRQWHWLRHEYIFLSFDSKPPNTKDVGLFWSIIRGNHPQLPSKYFGGTAYLGSILLLMKTGAARRWSNE